MGLSAVTYALAKKYTDNTVIGLGGLKGAPCKVKSIVKNNGRSVITLEWESDTGITETSEVYVNDGISIWISGRDYAVNDIVINDNILYICKTANSDVTFNEDKWDVISGEGSNTEYFIIDTIAERPSDLTSSDRRIYYCIADEAFYLWNGTAWSTISTGGTGLPYVELTKAEYDELTPAEKMLDVIYFVTDESGGGGGGGSAELTSDLTVVTAVGGVTAGTVYQQGTSLETIFRDMLAPILYPTLTNPSASMSATGAKLLEKGGSLNTTFTITFNRGSINPAYGTSGYRAGAADEYTLDGTTQSGNTFAITITESKTSYQGSVSYLAGEQPKDSAGHNYSSPLPAGSVNTNTITYEFVEAIWANVADITVVAKQALVSKSAKVKAMSFPAATAANPEIFDVPANWTVTAVEILNPLNNQWEDCSAEFDITDTTHDNAGGVSTAYKRYTNNLGYDMGARQIRFKWS